MYNPILKLNLNKINQYSNYTFNGDGVIQKISGDKSKFENKWFFVWTNDRNQTKKIIELSEELKPRFEKAVSTLIDYNNAEKPKEKF